MTQADRVGGRNSEMKSLVPSVLTGLKLALSNFIYFREAYRASGFWIPATPELKSPGILISEFIFRESEVHYVWHIHFL